MTWWFGQFWPEAILAFCGASWIRFMAGARDHAGDAESGQCRVTGFHRKGGIADLAPWCQLSSMQRLLTGLRSR